MLLGVDVGGTFTDAVVAVGGRLVTATAGALSSVRRCRAARSALAWVSPSRNGLDASEAVCRVWNVVRSPVRDWSRRRRSAHQTTVASRMVPARAASEMSVVTAGPFHSDRVHGGERQTH